MRNRSKFGRKIAGALTLLAAAVAVPVFAQTPQYYPTTTSPAPPGTLPPSNVRPSYGVNTNPGAATGKNNPRLTQPVIAGSDGVRPVSATEFDFAWEENLLQLQRDLLTGRLGSPAKWLGFRPRTDANSP